MTSQYIYSHFCCLDISLYQQDYILKTFLLLNSFTASISILTTSSSKAIMKFAIFATSDASLKSQPFKLFLSVASWIHLGSVVCTFSSVLRYCATMFMMKLNKRWIDYPIHLDPGWRFERPPPLSTMPLPLRVITHPPIPGEGQRVRAIWVWVKVCIWSYPIQSVWGRGGGQDPPSSPPTVQSVVVEESPPPPPRTPSRPTLPLLLLQYQAGMVGCGLYPDSRWKMTTN